MRSRAILAVSIAFTTCALIYPGAARSQNATDPSPSSSSATSGATKQGASQMVPALATLDKTLDARKVQQGQQFRATLSGTVLLKNGTELPRDTVLVGTIATDRMQQGGTSTLALRFTKAELKGGKVIPIQADIMGITGPNNGDPTESYFTSYNITPWDGTTLRVDEPGAVSGFDFHGRIGGENSAQFVSSKKDDMKLASGSQIALAIAGRPA